MIPSPTIFRLPGCVWAWLVMMVFTFSSPLSALTLTIVDWKDGDESGLFLTGGNWVGDAVPDDEDHFQVNASENITITLAADHEVAGYVGGASQGVFTLDLGGNTLTLSSTGTGWSNDNRRSFHVPNNSNLRTMTITNGTFAANDVDFRGSQTTVEVTSNAAFQAQGITLNNGSTMEIFGTVTTSGRIMTRSGSRVLVNGGTVNNTSNPIWAGESGLTTEALVHISNGATANFQIMIAGRDSLASGTSNDGGWGRFLVEGTGTTVTTERVFLSGGSRSTGSTSQNNPSPEGIGSLWVRDGAALSTDYLESYPRSTIFIDNATITVGNALMGSINGGILHPDSTLQIALNSVGQQPALILQQLIITDSTFEIIINEGFSANINEEITLMTYATTLVGEFDGFAEGETFTVDGFTFQLSYGSRGEDGAVFLTVIPEPATTAMMIALLAMLVAVGRKVGLRRG